jgi:lipoprotein NlpI
MTEANCYLGLQALLKGDKKNAEKCFAWVKVNGRKDYVEYEVASEELRRLTPDTVQHERPAVAN